MSSVEILVKCEECNEQVDAWFENFFCDQCKDRKDEFYLENIIEEAIEAVFKKNFDSLSDKDYTEPFGGLESQKELDIFTKGSENGYRVAFFVIADYFDLIGIEGKTDKIEKLIDGYRREK